MRVADVATIRLTEAAGLDRDRLADLLGEMGEPAAERLIGRSLEDLAVRLNRAERAWTRGDHVRLCHGTREMAEVAQRIGLTTFARSAVNVSQVAMTGDHAALAATVARLIRVGEASLMSVWDMRDMQV